MAAELAAQHAMPAAVGSGLHWCGGLAEVDWFGSLISPCYFESTASTLLLALTLVMLLAQGTRLALIQQLRAQGRVRKGTSGLNGSYIAIGLFLCGTHLLHFFLSLVLLRSYPFHIFYQGCLALVWATITAFAIYTGRLTASVDFRAVTIPAAAVYFISLYSFYRLYFDPHGVPLQYVKASIWSAMLQSVVAVLASWLGFRRATKTPATAALQAELGCEPTEAAAASGSNGARAAGYQPLPEAEPAAGTAGAAKRPPGAGGAADPDADKATWLSLFVDTCAYVWPETPGLQLRAVACLGLLGAMRVINLAVPILYKRVVNTLAEGSASGGGAPAAAASGGSHHGQPGPAGLGLDLGLGRLLWGAAAAGAGGGLRGDSGAGRASFGQLVWPWVALYLAAVFFQGGAGGGVVGFINNVRSYLWIPVSQDAFRRISVRAFDHVLSLDLTFHLRKKTGEVTKVVDRGTNAMQNILSTVLFNVLPQMFDVLAAATYLAQALEPTIAIIVFVTVGSYIPLTVIITEWRGKLRRDMNLADQVTSGRATDALLNYETVKYFTNERHESSQYAAAINVYQSAEFRSMSSINLLNVVQSAIMFCGIASGLLVCAGGVSAGVLTVGDVVLFLSLMAQLYAPLNFFGSYYRTIQQYMIDMENLFELLDKKSDVQDSPTARDLVVTQGELAFDHVSFWYEAGNPVLADVSFLVPGGQTLALVGATGSGKSTITRLIFRFYDVCLGAVRVDGQDVRSVTQASLRRAVGMVPQDTVLFNDTILHNIRYGNLTATDEEVYEAAKLACIHETIVNRFPKGYATIVGERGLRLSGGEKQRVAFARALLKNPAMLVLDEATSALDTITEKKIQSALAALRSDRTTVIVAHRLSTISDADLIVVMELGRVAEAGGHQQLLGQGGRYTELWARQAAATAATTSLSEGSAGPSSLRGSVVDLPTLTANGNNQTDNNAPNGSSTTTTSYVDPSATSASSPSPEAPQLTSPQPGEAAAAALEGCLPTVAAAEAAATAPPTDLVGAAASSASAAAVGAGPAAPPAPPAPPATGGDPATGVDGAGAAAAGGEGAPGAASGGQELGAGAGGGGGAAASEGKVEGEPPVLAAGAAAGASVPAGQAAGVAAGAAAGAAAGGSTAQSGGGGGTAASRAAGGGAAGGGSGRGGAGGSGSVGGRGGKGRKGPR